MLSHTGEEDLWHFIINYTHNKCQTNLEKQEGFDMDQKWHIYRESHNAMVSVHWRTFHESNLYIFYRHIKPEKIAATSRKTVITSRNQSYQENGD